MARSVRRGKNGIWALGTCLALGALLVGPGAAATTRAAHPGLPGPSRVAGFSYDIYSMNADGSGRTALTTDPADDFTPTWSPDGSHVAFASNRTGDYEIFVMNADGSGVTNLTNAPSANDYSPSWSPDGTKIAFTRNDG